MKYFALMGLHSCTRNGHSSLDIPVSEFFQYLKLFDKCSPPWFKNFPRTSLKLHNRNTYKKDGNGSCMKCSRDTLYLWKWYVHMHFQIDCHNLTQYQCKDILKIFKLNILTLWKKEYEKLHKTATVKKKQWEKIDCFWK